MSQKDDYFALMTPYKLVNSVPSHNYLLPNIIAPFQLRIGYIGTAFRNKVFIEIFGISVYDEQFTTYRSKLIPQTTFSE